MQEVPLQCQRSQLCTHNNSTIGKLNVMTYTMSIDDVSNSADALQQLINVQLNYLQFSSPEFSKTDIAGLIACLSTIH
jgi:hypothetical protein